MGRFRYTHSLALIRGVVAFGVIAMSLAMAAAAPFQPGDDKDKKSKEPLTTKIRLKVTAGEKDAPVDNASVYVRYEGHRHKMVEMNLKTNQDGSVKVPEVPRGKVLIQVIATGWKIFGQWYDVEKEEETINVKLEKPPHWY